MHKIIPKEQEKGAKKCANIRPFFKSRSSNYQLKKKEKERGLLHIQGIQSQRGFFQGWIVNQLGQFMKENSTVVTEVRD